MDSMPVDPPAPANFIRTSSGVLQDGQKPLTSLLRCEGGTLPYATPVTAFFTAS